MLQDALDEQPSNFQLDTIFGFYADRFSHATATTMDPQEFNKFLRDCKLMPALISKPQAGEIFNIVNKGEDADGAEEELNELEFLCACCHVATTCFSSQGTNQNTDGMLSQEQAYAMAEVVCRELAAKAAKEPPGGRNALQPQAKPPPKRPSASAPSPVAKPTPVKRVSGARSNGGATSLDKRLSSGSKGRPSFSSAKPKAQPPVLSHEQKEVYKSVFTYLDKDGSGQLELDEMQLLMRTLGKAVTNQEVEDLVDSVDADGNGTVDFDEFCGLMEQLPDDDDEETKIRYAFSLFDMDNSGHINVMELKQMLCSMGERMKEHELDQLMLLIDKDGSGTIEMDEMVSVLMCEEYRT